MNKRVADILKFAIFLGIGIFFIYWFLLKLEPEQKEAIWQAFCSANYIWVGVAMLCCLLSHWVRALRWQLLYTPLGIKPKISNTFGSVVVAYLANLAFPRLGEVARCATMRTSESIPLDKSLGTVVTERVVDVLLFGIIVLIGMLLMYSNIKDWLYNGLIQKFDNLPSITLLAIIGAVLVTAAIAAYKLFWNKLLRFAVIQKIDSFVKGCIAGIASILHLGRRHTWLFIIYSILIYLLYILGGLIIVQAFDETRHLPLLATFAIYLFGSIGMAFSQGGLGVYPVLVQMALAIYGISLEVGTAAGWLLWSSQQVAVMMVGAGYLIYFALIKRRNAVQQ